jgi:hypothetical protein
MGRRLLTDLKEFYEFLLSRGFAPTTAASYRSALRRMRKHTGLNDPKGITTYSEALEEHNPESHVRWSAAWHQWNLFQKTQESPEPEVRNGIAFTVTR